MNDMYKRMGDLRIGAESGLWARAYGGRISYDANNAYMKDSYWRPRWVWINVWHQAGM